MSLKNLGDVTYFRLNNEINRPINGVIPLHKDKEALSAFFKENVHPNMKRFNSLRERYDYLLENQYYDPNVINAYSFDFVERITRFVYARDFRFKSFMSAYKFYQQYALKTDDKSEYLETYEDRVIMNALDLANGDEELAMDLADEIINQRYQPATPTYLNSGKLRAGERVSCFLIDVSDDMNSIGRSINSALQLSKSGGGVGINLSNLREAGAPIKGIHNAASGVVPVMKLYEDSFSYANQLGQRQGAGVVYLSIHHPDIMTFLSTKKENADEKIRVKTLSLGLTVTDKFYELTRENDDLYTFSPYDVECEYGVPFSYVDIDREYDNLVQNPRIKKTKINARDLENEISKLQQESGYPYILNIGTTNRKNPNKGGRVIMSNLCSEILQTQQPSKVTNGQDYDVLGQDISCNLGSSNVVNLMTSPDFGKSVRTMLRALDNVARKSNMDVVPTIKNGNDKNHAVGLGALGLHSFLAQHHMEYGDLDSLEFTNIYFMLLNYWTLVESNNIAKETGFVYDGFDESTYKDGSYFEDYVNEKFIPQREKIKVLFDGVFIPTGDDWKALRDKIQQHGLANSYRLAIAPTGSISYVNDASASIHPIVQRIEERQEKMTGKIYYPARGLASDTIPYYTSAYDIDMRKVIDIYAEATKHVDQGMSLTLFMRSEIPKGMYEWKTETDKMTTRDLNILRHYAFHKGIKSIYYVRTFTADNTEVGSNECESCSI